MKCPLTFVIPVRHQANAKDWSRLRSNLEQTIRSIASQDSNHWQAIIVANHGADIPDLPPRFSIARVNFPPNRMHEQGSASKEDFYKAFRSDKGRRVLAGLLEARNLGHVMIVDDDDFVNRRLASFVAAHPEENGWFLREGYIWSDGGRFLYRFSDFSKLCGTSHIIRADLYKIPKSLADADESYVQEILGSHIFLHDRLDASNNRLSPLPFVGAVYRIGHPGAHSRSSGIFGQFFMKRALLKRPHQIVSRLMRVRILNDRIRSDFFGGS